MIHKGDTGAIYAIRRKSDNRKGCAHMERVKNDLMQQIRMCFQTYFNLYGSAPSEQVMREWLGISYEEKLPEYLNQMFAA